MGGIGSGNWYRFNSKDTTGSQKRIDVRFLKKQNYLRPDTCGSLSWSCNGEPNGSIRFTTLANGIQLNYRHRNYGEDWEEVEEVIHFEYTSCNYGGKRTWLLCPGCHKRVAIVYGAGKYFLCRHCYDLNYQTQHEDYYDRQISKSHEIRRKLGGEAGAANPFPEKPKGMHWKTYWKLYQQAVHGELCFIQKAERFLARFQPAL